MVGQNAPRMKLVFALIQHGEEYLTEASHAVQALADDGLMLVVGGDEMVAVATAFVEVRRTVQRTMEQAAMLDSFGALRLGHIAPVIHNEDSVVG